MAPKKEKSNNEDDRVVAFNEVERTILQEQVVECNRKIARLKSIVEEYEIRNEKLQQTYDKLDEDRSDVIAHLKKQLDLKNDEYNEVKEKLNDLTELKETENVQFRETITKLEKEFKTMKDQLTSQNKLLTSKLNGLEEFRATRNDLMQKFDKQEQKYEDQEMKYKRIIYNADKMFVIGKDKLKKEMEARLLQLAQDFQDGTECRIAASTHRVIRENIALNNELHNILTTQQKIADQNEAYKEKLKATIIVKELAEEERDAAINKSIIQRKVINQLTDAFETIKKDKVTFEKRNYDFEILQAKIHKLTKENDNLTLQVRILEQNFHPKLCDQNKATVDASKAIKERDKLRNILQDATFAIKAALKLDQWANENPKRQAVDRKIFLSHLLQILSQFHEIGGSESLATIVSFGKVYDEGDLGFVPKLITKNMSEQSSGSVIQQTQKQQQESVKGEIRKSCTTASSSMNSVKSSIKTIPSIQVLPATSSTETIDNKSSFGSFITSTQSTASSEQESEHEDDGKTDIEKQLLASKFEIQKSILKDLVYCQMGPQKSTHSLHQQSSELFVLGKISSTFSRIKSVTAIDSVQNVTDLNRNSSQDSVLSAISLKQSKIDVSTVEKVIEERNSVTSLNSLESKVEEKK